MKFELKYQPEKGGDWPFRAQYNALTYGPVRTAQLESWDDWCDGCVTDNGGWWRSGTSYWFKNREDALMFIVRWS